MAPPPSSGEGQENEPSTTGQPQANGSSDSKGQSVMHKDALGIDSSTSAKKLKPPRPETIEACPRCGSNDTKFCYYNNYNVKQPRFFCKSCQRYWTSGGTLRNVPPGSGRRKSKSQAAKEAEKQVAFAEQIAKQSAVSAMLAANSTANLAAVSYLNPMLTDPMLAYNAAQQQLLGNAALSALKVPGMGLPGAWPNNSAAAAAAACGLGGLGGPSAGLIGAAGDASSAPYASGTNMQGQGVPAPNAGAAAGTTSGEDGADADGAARAKRMRLDGAASQAAVNGVQGGEAQGAPAASGADTASNPLDHPNPAAPGQTNGSHMAAFSNGMSAPMQNGQLGGYGMGMGDGSMVNGGMGMPGAMGDPSSLMGMGMAGQQSAVVQQQQQQFMYQLMLQQQLLAQSQLAAAAGLGSANPYLSLAAYNPYFANGLAGLGAAGYGAGQAANPWAALSNHMMGGFPAAAAAAAAAANGAWPPSSMGMAGAAGGATGAPCPMPTPEVHQAHAGPGAGAAGGSMGMTCGLSDVGGAANALLGMTGGSTLASGHSSATGAALANLAAIPPIEGGDSH